MCGTGIKVKVAPQVTLSTKANGELLPFINLKLMV